MRLREVAPLHSTQDDCVDEERGNEESKEVANKCIVCNYARRDSSSHLVDRANSSLRSKFLPSSFKPLSQAEGEIAGGVEEGVFQIFMVVNRPEWGRENRGKDEECSGETKYEKRRQNDCLGSLRKWFGFEVLQLSALVLYKNVAFGELRPGRSRLNVKFIIVTPVRPTAEKLNLMWVSGCEPG